jgi:hypothetical protein
VKTGVVGKKRPQSRLILRALFYRQDLLGRSGMGDDPPARIAAGRADLALGAAVETGCEQECLTPS